MEPWIAAISALACLAPADQQQRWARQLGVRAGWITVLGGLAELAGGAVNLSRGTPADHPSLQLVDVFLMLEGFVRLTLLVAGGGRPVASLLGIPLRPLMERLMRPSTRPPTLVRSEE